MGLTIAGIDIGRSSISVCILSEIPTDLKRFKRGFQCLEFKPDRAGIDALLSLRFDGAIMEPTGGHYSKIWHHHLVRAGIEVRYVGHREVANYRESWKVFNKSDRNDAIALACYGLERWNRPEYFILGYSSRLRELYLELESLNRIRQPVILRWRQQLAHECPELSEKLVYRKWLCDSIPGVLKAVAGESTPRRNWQKILDESIGTGIGSLSRGLARQLIAIEELEIELEREAALELERPQYQPYLEILERYDIGGRTAAAILSVIFPFEQFLHNGKPIVERIDGTKRYRSLASFKLALGLGMVQYQSGGIQKWKPGGRADVRIALWRWAKMAIVMQPNLDLPAIATLRAYYDSGTDVEINGETKHLDPGVRNQRLLRVARRMLTMLFRDLVRM